MSTIKDVAKLAGVSISTVSLAMNTSIDDHRVSPQTWMKVHNAMDILNYTPNRAARKLRKNDRVIPSIGLFWPENFGMGILGQTLLSLRKALDSAYFACNIEVHMFTPDRLWESAALTKGDGLDGAILAFVETEDMAWLEEQDLRIPIVLLNRQVEKYSFIRSDNRAMGRYAAQIFLDRKSKNAAIFREEKLDRAVQRRREDFLKIYAAQQGTSYREYTFKNALNYKDVVEQTERMMKEGLPDSIVYLTNEQSAYTSIFCMLRQGVQIPDQVRAVVVKLSLGMFSRYVSPTATLVTASMDRMISDCAQILIHQIVDRNAVPVHKIYPPEIFYGETCPEL